MDKPLVSIIIPSFNRADLIAKTIESIQGQTHTGWECIVVDDGSTDATEEVVTAFAKADSRIRYYNRPNTSPKGANACRNYGFEKSKGTYINWLDSDDVFHPDKLDSQIKALKESPYSFSICQTDIWDERKQENLGLRSESIKSSTPLDDYIQFNIFWSIQAPLWKRKVIEKFRFNETLQQSQEYDYHIRVLAENTDYHTTNEILTTIISHSDNMSRSRVDQIDKFKSNLRVRYVTLKRQRKLISNETKLYLFTYIHDFYKAMILERKFYKALLCFGAIVQSIWYVEENKFKAMGFLFKSFLAIPSFYFFKKGEVLLKRLE